ncbi:MAG TPA: dihydropteroate synthase [Candidatus Acidoferrales bacterium]|nr:dihydropteroate synthase [Candidatus Acidoferrales bacterium]
MIWRCGARVFDLAERTLVMGIVNVTPDSFSDGGRYLEPGAAIARCRELVAAGADLIDVGAESTRPGSLPVPAAEQRRRLEPVLVALADVPVSVDTSNAEVAEAALALGACAVNDVTALADPAMAGVVARAGAGLVLMHMRGTPRTMQADPAYGDVVAEVADFLRQRLAAAHAGGVARECIALDPGIGFGKKVEHSVQLLAATSVLAALGQPVLVGASRKSFLGALTGESDPARRHEASLAAAAIAALEGARILRVHDVGATVPVVRIADAVRAARSARAR